MNPLEKAWALLKAGPETPIDPDDEYEMNPYAQMASMLGDDSPPPPPPKPVHEWNVTDWLERGFKGDLKNLPKVRLPEKKINCEDNSHEEGWSYCGKPECESCGGGE